jgi:hypothetical protein
MPRGATEFPLTWMPRQEGIRLGRVGIAAPPGSRFGRGHAAFALGRAERVTLRRPSIAVGASPSTVTRRMTRG